MKGKRKKLSPTESGRGYYRSHAEGKGRKIPDSGEKKEKKVLYGKKKKKDTFCAGGAKKRRDRVPGAAATKNAKRRCFSNDREEKGEVALLRQEDIAPGARNCGHEGKNVSGEGLPDRRSHATNKGKGPTYRGGRPPT